MLVQHDDDDGVVSVQVPVRVHVWVGDVWVGDELSVWVGDELSVFVLVCLCFDRCQCGIFGRDVILLWCG